MGLLWPCFAAFPRCHFPFLGAERGRSTFPLLRPSRDVLGPLVEAAELLPEQVACTAVQSLEQG